MTYLERLSPWCIVKLLPNMQRQVVGRCRRHNDAEEQLRVLHRLLPGARFVITFDPGLDRQNSADEKE